MMQFKSFTAGVLAASLTGLAIGGFVVNNSNSNIQDPGQPGMDDPQAMQDAMADWQKLMQPGEMHEMLGRGIGEWDMAIKLWMAGPNGPSMDLTGTSTIKWVLDKRFIQEESEWTMAMPNAEGGMDEMVVKGLGLFGYDNYQNMFVGRWADNQTTHILDMRGSTVPGSNTITWYGQMDEPMLNVSGRMVKYISRYIDDDKYIFEIIDLHAGDDYKIFEITYTRKR